MAKALPNMTPSDIIAEGRARFATIEALFTELAVRVEPLETKINVLDAQASQLLAEKQELELTIGILRDANAHLLHAFGAAVAKHPDLQNEFFRLKSLSMEVSTNDDEKREA